MQGGKKMKKTDIPRTVLWGTYFIVLSCLITSCQSLDATRYIPLRWIELHDSRHAECQLAGGDSFIGPISTRSGNPWRTSEWIDWMIDRMNATYAGTGIQFWLQSHDSYCTENLASLYRGPDTQETFNQPFDFAPLKDELRMLYPLAPQYDLTGDSLIRWKWIEKAFMLYGDRHGKTIYVHDDYIPGGPGQTGNLPLPQHGFGPWYTPGGVFLFLSGFTWAPGWEFDPELVPAHEIGHALGNCHTLDFKNCIGSAVFPGNVPYSWADHWDLSYVKVGNEIKGFASREQAEQWLQAHGDSGIYQIDNRYNIILDPVDGKMTVELEYDPNFTFTSESMVPSVGGGEVRLLQGLSFSLDYTQDQPNHTYAWQRNHMAYRYGQTIDWDPNHYVDAVDPFDYLTGRFSRSQAELMQKQLSGSNSLLNEPFGIHPPGTDSLFASLYQYLGDGVTEDLIWYSNGEGPASVDPDDSMEDRVAFRSVPAGTTGLDTGEHLVAGDFNGDGLSDLVWYGGVQLEKFLWSAVDNPGAMRNLHYFDTETMPPAPDKGISGVFSGDFDGNGADDLFLMRTGESTADVYFFKKNPSCRSTSTCWMKTVTIPFDSISGPVAVGNFDSAYGDDIVWGTYANGKTTAHVVWSDWDGSFTASAVYEVGDGEYAPYAGNFNGGGGDDVLWHSLKGGKEIFWWGEKQMIAVMGSGHTQQFHCGPGGSWDCVDASWGPISLYPRLAVGDYDGNGADDILVQEMHDPYIYFSGTGGLFEYSGNNTRVRVSLRNSSRYRMTVGEFDGMRDSQGRLGDDIYLFLRSAG
jgi:hypothetical protein